MKMGTIGILLVVAICASRLWGVEFRNLGFDEGTLTPVIDNVGFSFGYSAKDALPGWRAFEGTNEMFTVGYDNFFMSGMGESTVAFALISSNFVFNWTHSLLVKGKYGFNIVQSHVGPINLSIVQRGLVPPDAKFLQFRCVGYPTLYIDDVLVFSGPYSNQGFVEDLTPYDSHPTLVNHLLLAMIDVSKYAGKEVEIRFASFKGDHIESFFHGFSIDSIKFVSEPQWIDPKKVRVGSEGVSFQWIGSIGAKFQVESTTKEVCSWQPLGSPVTSTNGIFTFTDASALGNTASVERFYRVKAAP